MGKKKPQHMKVKQEDKQMVMVLSAKGKRTMWERSAYEAYEASKNV